MTKITRFSKGFFPPLFLNPEMSDKKRLNLNSKYTENYPTTTVLENVRYSPPVLHVAAEV